MRPAMVSRTSAGEACPLPRSCVLGLDCPDGRRLPYVRFVASSPDRPHRQETANDCICSVTAPPGAARRRRCSAARTIEARWRDVALMRTARPVPGKGWRQTMSSEAPELLAHLADLVLDKSRSGSYQFDLCPPGGRRRFGVS